MPRSAFLLDVALVLSLGLFLLFFSNLAAVSNAPIAASPTASSTVAIVPNLTLPAVTLPSLPSVTKQAAEETPAEATKPPAIAAPAPLATQTPALKADESIAENTPLEDTAITLRTALVNVFCTASAKSGLYSISGSGVVIDPKGIILTNAHVAEFFLLAKQGVSCAIRTGTPAAKRFTAALMYLPKSWLTENADILSQEHPVGTGEHDYAFLAVTGSATEEPLPVTFPYIPLGTKPPRVGTPIAVASYGSQSLGYTQIQSALYPTVVFGSVKDVFTFALSTIDIIALGGSAAAQQGSSGGGAADESGTLVGTITTSTTQGAVSTRALDAITASYIRADYASETGEPLDLLLSRPPTESVASFAPKVPTLQAIITAGL